MLLSFGLALLLIVFLVLLIKVSYQFYLRFLEVLKTMD